MRLRFSRFFLFYFGGLRFPGTQEFGASLRVERLPVMTMDPHLKLHLVICFFQFIRTFFKFKTRVGKSGQISDYDRHFWLANVPGAFLGQTEYR